MKPSTRRKLIELYQWWQIGNGLTQLPSRVLMMFGSISAGLAVYGIIFPIWIYLASIIIIILTIITAGYTWDKLGFYTEMIEFSNKRNTTIQKILKK